MDKEAQTIAMHERLAKEAKARSQQSAIKVEVLIERAKELPQNRSVMHRLLKRNPN